MNRLRLRFGALALVPVLGCANASDVDQEPAPEFDELTSVKATAIGNQNIGNCWAYTTVSWLEASRERAGGQVLDLSESYLSYWSAFQRMYSNPSLTSIGAGGEQTQRTLDFISLFGIINEREFIESEEPGQLSAVAEKAVEAINAWLAAGNLKRAPSDSWARRAYIRAMLDDAWQLSPKVRASLDAVFGKDVRKQVSAGGAQVFAKYRIFRPEDLTIAVYQPGSTEPRVTTLAAAIGAANPTTWKRTPAVTSPVTVPYRASRI